MINDGSKISGWFPIFDTFRGTRGEIKLSVEIEFFGNKTVGMDSNVGYVMFFSSSNVFYDYMDIRDIQGFVEELIVDVDPEYNWKDSFRTSRTSNEARQYLLYKLSGKLRREISNKVRELGGNAVIGFRHHFDFEEEGFIIARAYGTSVKLKRSLSLMNKKNVDLSNSTSSLPSISPNLLNSSNIHNHHHHHNNNNSDDNDLLIDQSSPMFNYLSSSFGTQKNSFKELSITKFMGFHNSTGSGSNNIIDDVKLLTIDSLPYPFKIKIGGIVTARSIKLIVKGNKSESRSLRDKWWTELREEIKSNARLLKCQYILGYREKANVKDGLVLLTATGTAVKASIKSSSSNNYPNESNTSSGGSADIEYHHFNNNILSSSSKSISIPISSSYKSHMNNQHYYPSFHYNDISSYWSKCNSFHVPYHLNDAPYQMKLSLCQICKKGYVPDMILATIDPPEGIQINGQCEMIEAYVCRSKKKCHGEMNAQQLSEMIPFLEYDLYKQIMMKLRLIGMNSCFSINTQIREGDNIIIAFAYGTAMFIPALPKPDIFKIKNSDVYPSHQKKKLKEILKLSQHYYDKLESNMNHNYYYPSLNNIDMFNQWLKNMDDQSNEFFNDQFIDTDSENSSDSFDQNTLLYNNDQSNNNPLIESNNNNGVIVEFDDKMDDELIFSLLNYGRRKTMNEIPSTSTKSIHMYPLSSLSNMGQISFIRVIDLDQNKVDLNHIFSKIIDSMYEHLNFRLKGLLPCSLCGVNIDLQIPDDDDIHILFTSTLLNIKDDNQLSSSGGGGYNDLTSSAKKRKKKKVKQQQPIQAIIPNVEITTLPYIPGAKVDMFLGRISLNFIKESFSTREHGGMNSFAHNFLVEVQMIARSHVRALGGNALLSFKYEICDLTSKSSKNQAYCMISLTGDAVKISHNDNANIGYEKIAQMNNKSYIQRK